MLDLRSHRKRPYQDSLVSHRRSSSRTAPRGSSMPLLPPGRLDEEPAATKSTTTGGFHSGQTTLSPRTPERRRLRLFRTIQKLNQQQTQFQQQEQQEQEQEQEQEHVRQSFGEGETMDTEVEATEPMPVSAIIDQETSSMDVDAEQDDDKVPAILRLCPEVLALIFHYVYVTPVVHRPPVVVIAVKPSSSADTEMQQQEPQAQTSQQQGQNQQESPMATEEDQSSSQDMSTTPTSSLSLSSPPSSSSSASSFSSTETRAGETTAAAIVTSDTPTTITTTTAGSGASTTRRTKKDKRVSSSSVYIQNDLSSMLSLCLTCRAFYPQAIRMLWRQRTLTNFDELTQFYQAIDFSAALTKRHQKQRHLLQQQQQQQHELRRLGLGMGYAMEEGLFANKAALRIKSLTLLDMSLGSSLATLPLAAVVASANASSSLSASGESALSNPFFGSGSNHAGGDPASLDLCQGIDSLSRTSSALDDSLAMAGLSKEDATMANASSSSSSSSSSGSSSLSSSSSSSSSSALAPHSPAQSRRRHRQKTTSIYSDMVSPRLLHTIAHHCHALVDLTLCMDKKSTSGISHDSTTPRAVHQPTIPLSILAGSLLSLKRLALMGLMCDPQRNKTASELLVFAQNIQPLEQLSIRSCQGIGLDTFVEFASRSSRRLLSVDFQGLDFKTSQELADVMAAFAVHCRSVKSVTLSCLNSLALDGTLEALAYYGASELQELHVLGHNTLLTPVQIQQQQQQQQQGLAGAPAPGAIPQQEQQPQQQEQPADNNNPDGGVPVPFTQMCHLADANAALSSLARIPLRRLTLYCPGITDYALLLYLAQAKQLVDLVLQEPTTMVIHHPQFHNFVQQYHPAGPPPAPTSDGDQATQQAPGSSSFLGLIRARCTGLKYLFMKLTLETAQEWIAQECFRQAGLDKCLYQYRTATGAPAVVLMWDSRARRDAVAAASTVAPLA
ncbi:hypothetical protein BGW39_011693 [Mortierella sp. 14UC]|nr:hypothetical protein BGW39_011693 [Mortierella sp. 14UC]